MKTKALIIFSILLSTALSVNAQQKRPSLEDMHNKKWAEISTKAELNDNEIKATYPIFIDYENKLWNLNKENRDLFREIRKKTEKKETINYTDVNNKYIDFEIKQSTLLKDYHTKISKILSPEKLFNYYHAERIFKRNLLQNMQQHQRGQKNK